MSADPPTRSVHAKGVTTPTPAQAPDPIRYRAEQAADGTWSVYNVPIFSAHEEKLRDGTVRKFDRAWLEGALRAALVRQAEGYLPPAHVRHHDLRGGRPDAETGVEAAGYVRMTRVGSLRVGGVETPTLFADLVGLRPEVYDRIRRGALPYRSVELLNVGKGEIDSLAFLDHEVPFFRYPLLRVEELQATAAPSRPLEPVAFSATGDRLAVLFAAELHLQEDDHMTDHLQTLEEPVDPAQRFGGPPMAPPQQQPQQPPQNMAAPAPAPAAAPPAPAQQPGGGLPPWGSALVQAIVAALKGGSGGASMSAATADEAPADPAPAGAGPVEVGVPGSNFGAQGDELEGEPVTATAADVEEVDEAAHRRDGTVDALQARLATLEAELETQRSRGAASAFAAGLQARGFSAQQAGEVERRWTQHGEQAARAYADGLVSVGPRDPQPHWSGDLARGEGEDLPEVTAYQAGGPEALAHARELARSWKALQAAGSTQTLKDFLATNMDPDGYATEASYAGRRH